MGWSGATFTLIHDFSAFRDANPGAEYIDADDVDEQFTDIKGGLEALLLRDGSNSPSDNINWGGFLITNLGAPTAAAHAARRQEVNKALGPAMGGLTEYTIATGAITPAGQAQFNIDTESDASADDLDTITATNYTSDQLIMIRANNSSRRIVVKHGTGNINTAWADDITLNTLEKWVMLRYDGSDWHEVSRSPELPSKLLRDQMIGFTLSNSLVDSDHDVTITSGVCVDVSGRDILHLESDITKQIDAAWAVGDDAGGLDTGSVAADTVYYLWVIMRSDTRVVDVIFSTSPTSGTLTLPASYDRVQLIGAITTNSSSNIKQFYHYGEDEFVIVTDATVDITDTTITDATFETGTLIAPANSEADIHLLVDNTSETSTGSMKVGVRQVGSTIGLSDLYSSISVDANSALDGVGLRTKVLINPLRQFQYAASETAGSARVRIVTRGWRFLLRGRAE